MYCICHKISFKDILSLASDYNFDINCLIKNGVCATKCQLCIEAIKSLMKELNPDSVVELEFGKIYHFHFNDPIPTELLQNFAKNLKDNFVKGIITIGSATAQDITDTILSLPAEYKNQILMNLNENKNYIIVPDQPDGFIINPLSHEQSK